MAVPPFWVMPMTGMTGLPADSVGNVVPPALRTTITAAAPAAWALATFDSTVGLLLALRSTTPIQAPSGVVPVKVPSLLSSTMGP